jgi:UDP-N-acetylmuramoyl-tripeptide--D-alanyl-D-alanine ligase
MIPLTISQISEVISGKIVGDKNKLITGAAFFDSRQPVPNGIFLALKGEHVDGHDFALNALQGGAGVVICTQEIGANCIVVPDVVEAITKLAAYVRQMLTGMKVIAITGSHGKTTTKDLSKHLLSMMGKTVAPKSSFNNDLGVPITILECTNETKFCILEMGARNLGDISKLERKFLPDLGVVLGVGSAHIGVFGSQEIIASAKSEMVKNLESSKIAILGSYDDLTINMKKLTKAKVVTFGENSNNDVRATDVEIREGFAHFDLVTSFGRESVALRQAGRHQVANALAAAAIATALNMPIDKISAGLSTAETTSKWRMELHEVAGRLIINDSYNANPESMFAALDSLRLFAQERGGRAWAFLGKMHELGNYSLAGHQEVARKAIDLEIDHLVAIGTKEYQVESELGSTEFLLVENIESAREIAAGSEAGDVILVKGSRAEGLEKLAELLIGDINELPADKSEG